MIASSVPLGTVVEEARRREKDGETARRRVLVPRKFRKFDKDDNGPIADDPSPISHHPSPDALPPHHPRSSNGVTRVSRTSLARVKTASQPATESTQAPPERSTAAATAPTSSGPVTAPTSPMSRQIPRNSPVAPGGARSAPSVIIRPEPSPLPNPISMATSSRVRKSRVNGINPIPRAISAKL